MTVLHLLLLYTGILMLYANTLYTCMYNNLLQAFIVQLFVLYYHRSTIHMHIIIAKTSTVYRSSIPCV